MEIGFNLKANSIHITLVFRLVAKYTHDKNSELEHARKMSTCSLCWERSRLATSRARCWMSSTLRCLWSEVNRSIVGLVQCYSFWFFFQIIKTKPKLRKSRWNLNLITWADYQMISRRFSSMRLVNARKLSMTWHRLITSTCRFGPKRCSILFHWKRTSRPTRLVQVYHFRVAGHLKSSL